MEFAKCKNMYIFDLKDKKMEEVYRQKNFYRRGTWTSTWTFPWSSSRRHNSR